MQPRKPAAIAIALLLSLAVPQGALAQLEEPEGSCFEPVKPACAEVTVESEDEGWALRCQEELTQFLEEVDGYRQCVVNRIDRMREQASEEREHMNCLVESEGSGDC
ncbi:hypothetical protein [Aquibaculum arenosum]|uniref:Secreted protein n=1 Tax=Aquibaculum arenosum TaxID=3032591 RepID=A0ABT5YLJ9_9PROT|nr:hypothetical protein [Fodinicurvata sp. CAU 1616]MDF2095837.1 hypothetical protein [Fodinicurvata sp. CAU 1616]